MVAEGGDVPIVVDSVDLHYVRHLREAELKRSRKALAFAVDEAPAELVEYATASGVVVATEEDEQTLRRDLGVTNSFVLTTIHRAREAVPPPQGREGILFVGGYAHPPNLDAVEWLMKEIVPRLADRGCHAPVYVAGSRMPTKLARLVHRNGGEVLGFVPRLDPVYDRMRCMVAPLRFGAGMKGKIGEALAAGLPTVTTTIGAEGFPANEGMLVSDDADAIADDLVRVLSDDALWMRASEAGRATVREHLGPDRCVAALRAVLATVTPGAAVAEREGEVTRT